MGCFWRKARSCSTATKEPVLGDLSSRPGSAGHLGSASEIDGKARTWHDMTFEWDKK